MIVKTRQTPDEHRNNRREPLMKCKQSLTFAYLLACIVCLLLMSCMNLYLSTSITTQASTGTFHQPLLARNQEDARTMLLQTDTTTETEHGDSKLMARQGKQRLDLAKKGKYRDASVDILSIGSANRLNYLKTQQKTFATHRSVRYFFNATENDDVDKGCHMLEANATSHLASIIDFCRGGRSHQHSTNVSSHQNVYRDRLAQKYFAPDTILSQKANPMAWLCAQTRPAVGLHKVLQWYYKGNYGAGDSTAKGGVSRAMMTTTDTADENAATFPDYLIIIDDDTYLNMDLVHQLFRLHFQNERGITTNAVALAGCLIRLPHMVIPHGGFGFILNKATLERISMTPIKQLLSYDGSTSTYFTASSISMPAALKLIGGDRRKNLLDDQRLLDPDLSLVELIFRYAIDQKFSQHKNWTHGFCAHSDWLWGYFFQEYNVLEHPHHNHGDEVGSSAFGSIIPLSLPSSHGVPKSAAANKRRSGLCTVEKKTCDAGVSPICHRVTPRQMIKWSASSEDQSPMKYKNA